MDARTGTLEEQQDFYGRYVYIGKVFPFYMSQTLLDDKAAAIRDMLAAAGLAGEISRLDCMEVGMGRQSLCLALLGARSVAHFDVSASQQRRFASHVAQHYPELPITSRKLDICREALGAERFDFILLEGVIHHTVHVARALANCLAALRPGGKMWLMFYRSGCFQWFVCAMIRRMLRRDGPGECLDYFYLWFQRHGVENYQTLMNLVDDLFVPHIQLFTPFSYAAFLEAWGCGICGGKDLEPLVSLDHAALPNASALIVRKLASPRPGRPPELLDPERAVDQLDPRLYREPGPLAAIECFSRAEPALLAEQDRQRVYDKAILLHQLASPANWGLPAAAPDYDRLVRILLG
jgi:hypothetical protein